MQAFFFRGVLLLVSSVRQDGGFVVVASPGIPLYWLSPFAVRGAHVAPTDNKQWLPRASPRAFFLLFLSCAVAVGSLCPLTRLSSPVLSAPRCGQGRALVGRRGCCLAEASRGFKTKEPRPEEVQSTKEKHGDNGMFFIDDPQSDQAVEGSADFEDTDASSGIGDDEDAEGSGDEHLSEEEMGSGTVGPVFVTPKVTVVTDTKHPPKHSAKPKGPSSQS
ncbi:hypothetical protein MRX96_047599 [Rhipicephalus microplus]